MEIRGEYWIADGHVDYADGDVGDYNHEGIACQHISHKYYEEIVELAEELGVEHDSSPYEENPDTEGLLNTIHNHLEEKDEDADSIIQKHLGVNDELYRLLRGGAGCGAYLMKNEGWIAVRSTNVDLYGWNERTKKSLATGLGDIIEQEHGWDHGEENLEWYVTDHKTKKQWNTTIEELQEKIQRQPEPAAFIPQKPPIDRRFATQKQSVRPDSHENTPVQKNYSIKNNWNNAAKAKGIIGAGQELWRGTSEGVFRQWLSKHE